MKLFVILFAMAITCCTDIAHAQENWDTYMAKFGDKPGSVLVDLGLHDHAPDKKFPYLLITGPQAQKCNGQGLPDKNEIDGLEEILAATGNFITGVTAKVLTGTLTYNCERLNYYYIKDTMGIRNAIMRLYNRSYPNYQFAVNMKYDPEWQTYATFLYPSDDTRNWMENIKMMTKIKESGDSLTGQRNFIFDVYFKTGIDRSVFADFARIRGYTADTSAASTSSTMPYEVLVSKKSLVKIESVQAMTEELKAAAKKYRGLYNGWEAKPQTPKGASTH
jgi:hypothetical protein